MLEYEEELCNSDPFVLCLGPGVGAAGLPLLSPDAQLSLVCVSCGVPGECRQLGEIFRRCCDLKTWEVLPKNTTECISAMHNYVFSNFIVYSL